MTDVSSSVDVAVDPLTAFTVFTDEMDLWYVRSPITFYDSARAIEQRCEHGVGGRVLEVYEDGARELARITVWEPGKRLSWKSSQDDVEVDIWFEESTGGTTVRVDARVPEGGADRGATSIVRIGPMWFGRWVARRDHVPHVMVDQPRLNLEIYYERPVTAAHWLARAFGFEMPDSLPDDESAGIPGWIETQVGGASIMIFRRDHPTEGAASHVPFVYVDDLDSHLARAEAAGATIVQPIVQHGYRRYVCEDLEGNRWSFAQARPTMR